MAEGHAVSGHSDLELGLINPSFLVLSVRFYGSLFL